MSEVLCVIEIPKGSRNKYEWSPEHGVFLLDRVLSSSVVFPTDSRAGDQGAASRS